MYHDLDRDLAHTGKLTDSKCTTVFQVLYDKNLNGPGRTQKSRESAGDAVFGRRSVDRTEGSKKLNSG